MYQHTQMSQYTSIQQNLTTALNAKLNWNLRDNPFRVRNTKKKIPVNQGYSNYTRH